MSILNKMPRRLYFTLCRIGSFFIYLVGMLSILCAILAVVVIFAVISMINIWFGVAGTIISMIIVVAITSFLEAKEDVEKENKRNEGIAFKLSRD